MTATFETILVALFGGAGATVVWELILKPRRDQRSLAEVLAAEVSINIQYLAVAFVSRNPSKVPPDFRLSTTVFESVVGRLGELPPALVGEVVFLYRYFEELNRLPEKYVGYVNDLRSAMAADTNRRNQIDREIQACVDVYNSYLDKCIDRLNLVQPMLLNVAFPFWSPRTWRRAPSKSLSLGEAGDRMTKAIEHRAAIAAGLRKS